jgi:hypothetical protein
MNGESGSQGSVHHQCGVVYCPHMFIYKCDVCGKTLPEKAASPLTVGYDARNHFCKKCAAPFVRILKRYKLADQKI